MTTTANLDSESMPEDTIADVNYDAEACRKEPFTKKEVNAVDLNNGFWERHQAKYMARKPYTYLCGSLFLAFLLSVIAISSENGGWVYRDATLVSDAQTQLLLTQIKELLTQIKEEHLFTGGDDAWEDLLVTSEASENTLLYIFRYTHV
jgi:hypothetical protein